MAEILITGMEMLPEGFAYDVRIKGNGDVVDRLTGVVMGKAIEVPPHGRLGDLDKLQKKVEGCAFVPEQSKTMYMMAVEKEIKKAPTIIEASKERE